MSQDVKTSSLPNLNYQKANRNVSQVDLSILQKSKTIQSDNWEILHRVKQSLESNTFNNFFASSLAKLPSYKSPQELAKALAEQFIQNEIQLTKKQRATKSATRTQLLNFHSQNESLPAIKPNQLQKIEKLQRKIRSKSRDQKNLQKTIQPEQDTIILSQKERQAILKQKLGLKEKIYRKEIEKQKQVEKEKSQMIESSPEKEKKAQRTLRYTIQTVRLPPPSPSSEPAFLYTYNLGLGNNHELVKRIFDGRPEWHQTPHASRANFRWQQSYIGYKYFKLNWHRSHKEMVNHFEFHPEISNKKNLLLNISAACETTKTNPFEIIPVTFAFDFSDPMIECNVAMFFNFFNKNAPIEKQLNKTDFQAKLIEIKKKLRIGPAKEKKISDFTMLETFIGPDYLWLLKPTGLNRGRGIHVFQEIDNLVELLIDYQYGYTEKQTESHKDENGQFQQKTVQYILKTQSFVIQKYIEKPLLINNRKFDIRVWVLVNVDMSCYFFREGYIRTASEDYCTNDTQNLYIHLTNNAIQKHSEKYGEQEDGNQLSFDQVQKYYLGKINFREQIVEKMKELSYFAMNAVASKLNKLNRKFCMEIFGFDFFLDELFNLYLIEVNTNPCLEESSPLLAQLIPRMLDDAFKLTVDQIFPIQYDAQSKYPVNNYPDDKNMWQLMGELQDIQPHLG